MNKIDSENPILTKNDQEVLKNILDQKKLSDSEIARKLRLSQQAIFKIRQKLENKGIIEGYMPVINLKKIGINVLTVLLIRVRSAVWEQLSEELVAQRLKEIPNVITALRIPESDITHLLIMGFTNISQKDKVLMKFQSKFINEVELKAVYPFSVDRIISMSPLGLLYEIIDKKDIVYDHLFIKQNPKK